MDIPSTLLYTVLGSVSLVALRIYWSKVAGKSAFISSTNCFVFLQVLWLIGTFMAVDLTRTEDRVWLAVNVGALVCFIVGCLFANAVNRFNSRAELVVFLSSPVTYDLESPWIILIVVVTALASFAVGVAYAIRVGYNVFFLALRALAAGDVISQQKYSRLRLSISVEKYAASGYAAQFVLILLPLVLCLLYFRIRRRHRLGDVIACFLLAVADVYFLTIQGGRGWLVLATLQFVLLVSKYGPLPVERWCKAPMLGRFALCAAIMFGVSATVVSGRASNFGEGVVSGVSKELYARLFGSAIADQLTVIRQSENAPIPAGALWWRDLVSMLPAKKGIASGNELYAMAYNGDTTGSMGLLMWGSCLYNWGPTGTLLVAVFSGYLIQRFTIACIRGPRLLSRIVVLFVAGLHLEIGRAHVSTPVT